jgi:hypothetical protein
LTYKILIDFQSFLKKGPLSYSIPLSITMATQPIYVQNRPAAPSLGRNLTRTDNHFINACLGPEYDLFTLSDPGRHLFHPQNIEGADSKEIHFRTRFATSVHNAITRVLIRTESLLSESCPLTRVAHLDFDHPVIKQRVDMVGPLPEGISWIQQSSDLRNFLAYPYESYEEAIDVAKTMLNRGKDLCLWAALAYDTMGGLEVPDSTGLRWNFPVAFAPSTSFAYLTLFDYEGEECLPAKPAILSVHLWESIHNIKIQIHGERMDQDLQQSYQPYQRRTPVDINGDEPTISTYVPVQTAIVPPPPHIVNPEPFAVSYDSPPGWSHLNDSLHSDQVSPEPPAASPTSPLASFHHQAHARFVNTVSQDRPSSPGAGSDSSFTDSDDDEPPPYHNEAPVCYSYMGEPILGNRLEELLFFAYNHGADDAIEGVQATLQSAVTAIEAAERARAELEGELSFAYAALGRNSPFANDSYPTDEEDAGPSVPPTPTPSIASPRPVRARSRRFPLSNLSNRSSPYPSTSARDPRRRL